MYILNVDVQNRMTFTPRQFLFNPTLSVNYILYFGGT